MNKRFIYLLTTLLIAESAMPISAQSLIGQTSSSSAVDTTYLTTLAKDSTLTNRTTDASVTVSVDRIYATEVASARTELSFRLHKTTLIKDYTEQAASLHIALTENIKLFPIVSKDSHSNLSTEQSDDYSIETLGTVTIHDNQYFTFHFTAENIDADSILKYDHFEFKIPGYLLTCQEDLTVKVPIEKDKVELPTLPPAQTTSAGIKLVHFNDNQKYTAIRYTLDGTDVTWDSPVYQKGVAIEVSPSDTLTAVAYIGTMPSEPKVFAYEDIKVESHTDSDNDSTSGDDSSNNGSTPGGGSSNSGSTSGGSSSNGGGSTSGSAPSTSQDNSSSDQNEESSVDMDTPVDTESSQPIADCVSDVVTNLITTQKRDLTLKATEVSYGLTINNQKVALENKLLIHNGRTLAPLRTIIEALNIPIHYHAASKTAIIQTEDCLMEFPLGYNVAIVNGKVVPIDVNDSSILSTIQNGRTYLPLRFIAEQLNLSIHFDGEQIHINA